MKGSKDSGIGESERVSDGHTMLYSATEIENSNAQDGGTKMSIGEFNDGKDDGRIELKHIFNGRKVYSTLQTRNSSHGASKICRHGVPTTGQLVDKENEDNMSQEENESESFDEENLVKAVSYERGIQFSQTSCEDFRVELSENDEEALKEELIHIFERERSTLEMFFRNKMEERLLGFRNRQIEFEEAARTEKIELENSMSMEKMEMQRMFAEEIAKLTSSFNEERQQFESYYKEQLKDLREQLRTEQKQMDERFTREKTELKEKLENEYQVMAKQEISHEKEQAIRCKNELEARLHMEKMELEKGYNLKLAQSEGNLERLKAEFEAKLANERMLVEKQNHDSLREIEAKLQEETRVRHVKEKELAQDREKYFKDDSLKRKENEQLKNDIDFLRKQIDEKNRETLHLRSQEEKVRLKGRDGLEGKLRDDFDKLLEDHKKELEKNYQRDKEKVAESLEAERWKIKEEHDREKEKIKFEQDNAKKERLRSEEKAFVDWQQQMGRDGDLVNSSSSHIQDDIATEELDRARQEQRSDGDRVTLNSRKEYHRIPSRAKEKHVREQMKSENEINRQVFSNQRTDLAIGSKDLNFNKEISSEGHGERDHSMYLVSPENRENSQALQSEINALQRENEGLRAKISALEENIELHKKYKEEAKAEIERLLKKNQQMNLKIQKLAPSEKWNVTEEETSIYNQLPTNGIKDSQYKVKYEATLREKNKLLQVTKEMETKIRNLQEKQIEILRHSSHVEKSSEKSEETERLKQLMSENSSLKQRTFELQSHLKELLEKLKNDKDKDLQERLAHTGRVLSASKGDLDPDALKRIEKEVISIGQIVKTQFGKGSMGHERYTSTNEDLGRVTKLEVEKKELELKLKTAREAMSEYISRLNDKMKDVKSMTGMSEEMVLELHTRNNNLKKSLQTLEEGQKASQLQTEQLRKQKAALQNLIGGLCRDGEIAESKHDNEIKQLAGDSYSSQSSFLEQKYESRSDEPAGMSYKPSSGYSNQNFEGNFGRSSYNRYGDFKRSTEARYTSVKDIKKTHDTETSRKGSRVDQFSVGFDGHPSSYSTFEYEDLSQVGSQY
ncbi:golgin subfamily A member 6-like protein 6 [Montipora capricornis]|uniref:golgin subfamily A member 6-like protein 6 n=1 Tax=Montipora capricornis TaxID=246305 RepID=UPI0035F207A4